MNPVGPRGIYDEVIAFSRGEHDCNHTFHGSETRIFCYFDDLMEGIYRFLISDCADLGNVENSYQITIWPFAEEIIKLTSTDQKVIYEPLHTDVPKQPHSVIIKPKAIMNWEPKIDSPEGLLIIWEYFKSPPMNRLIEESKSSFH